MRRAEAEAMDAADPLARFRERFLTDDSGPIYMDGNSLGRPSTSVTAALQEGMREWERDLVGGWSRWIELPVAVGDRIGSLVGAAPGQVVVSDSTTVNLYKLAAAAISARPDRRVIVADAADFPTDRYVLQSLAATHGHELRMLQGNSTDGLDPDALAAAVDDRTALVCLSHVNYRSGARLDLADVTAIAHRHGALVLWDLCHSAGAVPVDLDGAEADLAVGCTYKYLNAGPGAPAFLYVARHLQPELRQPIWGWFGQRDQFAMAEAYDPVAGVERFLVGSPPVLGLLAVGAGIEALEEAGMAALWDKSRSLTALVVEQVRDRLAPLGAELASPADPIRRGAHVSVSHPEAWPWCAELTARGLVVGDFRTPDVIRLGPAPLYTRYVDAYDAVERMAEVLAAGLPDHGERPRVT